MCPAASLRVKSQHLRICSIFIPCVLSCSLPAAGLLEASGVFCGRPADGRGSRCYHRQGDTSGEPRGTERVAGLGKVLGRLFHRGEMCRNRLERLSLSTCRQSFCILTRSSVAVCLEQQLDILAHLFFPAEGHYHEYEATAAVLYCTRLPV